MTPLSDNEIMSFNGNLVWPIKTDKLILQRVRRIMDKLEEAYPDEPCRYDVWITDFKKGSMATTSRMLADLLPRVIAEQFPETPAREIPDNVLESICDFVQANFHFDPIYADDVDYDSEMIYRMFQTHNELHTSVVRSDRVLIW